MTARILAALLILGLVLTAVAGPWALRRASPVLMRLPRPAIGLLAGGIVAWVLALLALGPMLAWVVSGPDVLPSGAAQVCRRCLAAANPFTDIPVDTVVPVVALLALPTAGALLHAVSIIVEARRRHRGTLRTARRLRARSEPRRLHGHAVLVADDPHPFALTLPRRHGGIVISTGALDVLDPGELAAVLAHEHAHLRQRHHLITAVVATLTRRLRWVPLIAAAEAALGHYLEIAADDTARRQVGTPALAGALLTLGQNGRPQGAALAGALHALGPNRIHHLVRPHTGMTGAIAAVATACCLTALTLLAAAVHVPYVLAVLTGCA
ncbi:M56 family metallopeptidase [Nonomuraea sp. NPDC049725]|uniref:M56 family metallopeptidase n=1 Tax=Nonomuraea sp. NPDC049725 TaxID=3154508 RepID=UPI00342A4C2C